jgi:CRISPR/Cas system-associated exonuclease Cas4 (RecB family)
MGLVQKGAVADPPDCVPARMVNEFAYCPRLAYIEWVQGDFRDSADTIDGRFRHRVVDKEDDQVLFFSLGPIGGEHDSKVYNVGRPYVRSHRSAVII